MRNAMYLFVTEFREIHCRAAKTCSTECAVGQSVVQHCRALQCPKAQSLVQFVQERGRVQLDRFMQRRRAMFICLCLLHRL